MSARKSLIVLLFACFGLLLAQPAVAMAAPLKVEALGFFSHPPMWETRDTIQKVCQEFGDRVDLVMYDETTADGEKFMQSHNLSGHIPMVLYINGSLNQQIRDFVNWNWKAEDLKQAIKLALEGKKAAVPEPADTSAEVKNPKTSPVMDPETCPMMQAAPSGNTSDTPARSLWVSRTNLLFAGLGLAIVVLLVALLLSRRRAPKGE